MAARCGAPGTGPPGEVLVSPGALVLRTASPKPGCEQTMRKGAEGERRGSITPPYIQRSAGRRVRSLEELSSVQANWQL